MPLHTTVRLLDGSTEIASHVRSYDRHHLVEDPAHRHALLEQKRKALGSTPSGRLAAMVPESPAFLQAAFERGESTARLTLQLLLLLDDYGPGEWAATLRETLDRHTPRLSSVAFILGRCCGRTLPTCSRTICSDGQKSGRELQSLLARNQV